MPEPIEALEEDVESEPKPAALPFRVRTIFLWLLIIGLGLLMIPLSLVGSTITQVSPPLETELSDLVVTLTSVVPKSADQQNAQATLFAIQDQITALDALRPTLIASHRDWPALMSVIANYDLTQMKVTALREQNGQVILSGEANNEAIVMNYAQHLRDAGLFENVSVQSIALRTLDTPTPTATTVVVTEVPIATNTLLPNVTPLGTSELNAILKPSATSGTAKPSPTQINITDEPRTTLAVFSIAVEVRLSTYGRVAN